MTSAPSIFNNFGYDEDQGVLMLANRAWQCALCDRQGEVDEAFIYYFDPVTNTRTKICRQCHGENKR